MIRIITDSAADFEPAEIKDLNITCIPMKVSFESEEYKENENLTKNQFYKLLEEREEFPKTSQPSPYDFQLILQDFADNEDECVIITISSALSGTYQNASLVKEMLDYSECYVIDSLNATGGQRLLVEHAVKLRNEGKSAQQIAEELEHLKHKITLFACIDTLEYLHKGGRVSKAAYTVGSFANIKPIIYLSKEGTVEVSSKALSTKSGINSVCKKFLDKKPDISYPIYILYSNNRQNAELLTKSIREQGYPIHDKNIVNIGATIGAHVGSNACGVVYVSEESASKL